MIAKPPERVNVRARESSVTRSAWRLAADSDNGTGAILVVEVSSTEVFYRGEGIFLGWPQEKLALMHQQLLPRAEEPQLDIPQLG